MNELQEQAIRILNNTVENITGSASVDQAKETAQLTQGYLVGTRLLNIINPCQYDAMTKLVKIAVEAVERRAEKTAPGVTSTESGSKEGHPKKDDSLTTSSVVEKPADVKKRTEVSIIVDESGVAHTQVRGSAIEISACISGLIENTFKAGIPTSLITAAVITGSAAAGIILNEVPKC